jgi:hypothetical protein
MRTVPTDRLRCARFERFEDRIVFSGAPWSAFCEREPDFIIPLPDWEDIAPALPPVQTYSSAPTAASQLRADYGFDGSGQTVAVIDSGIAYEHWALGGGLGDGYRVVGGWDFTEESDADPHDDGPGGFHGTHVSGIIASDDSARPGVAPGVDLVGLRVFNDMGMGYVEWVERALRWVHQHRFDFQHPITTVNLSLGSAWNGSNPPSWATFEDELALLEQDGIFVAVAAGNSFADYGVPGLSYPAASPYVVPIGSVDAQGNISDFSQRLGHMLAAPGEDITSTVPDHIFGADGYYNDWASVSGTSMAAPYVAGASTLVRQALEFTSDVPITQDDIYQQLWDTADLVYDATSQTTYHRVNLQAAIEAAMPTDQYGSTVDDAHDLGTIGQLTELTGYLARLDDQDYFQFTAAHSGELILTVTADEPVLLSSLSPEGTASPHPDAEASDLSQRERWLSMQVQAGTEYIFSLAADTNITQYSVCLEPVAQDAVQIDGHVVQVTGTAGEDAFRFNVSGEIELLVNGQMHRLARDRVWEFQFSGGGGTDTFTFHGSAENEQIQIQPGQFHAAGTGFELSACGIQRVYAYANEGCDDVVRLTGSDGNDEFIGRPSRVCCAGPDFTLRCRGSIARTSMPAVGATTLRGATIRVATTNSSPGPAPLRCPVRGSTTKPRALTASSRSRRPAGTMWHDCMDRRVTTGSRAGRIAVRLPGPGT